MVTLPTLEAPAPAHAVRDLCQKLVGWHRPLMVFCAILVPVAVACVLGIVLDHRQLIGESVWLKPLKFCLSIITFGTTLAWLLSLLRRTPKLAYFAGCVITGAGTVEMVGILAQAARDKRSHFNVSTPLDSTIFGFMGFMITVLWVVSMLIGVIALCQRLGSKVTTSALRYGLGLSVLGMAVGFLMVGPTPQQQAALQRGTGTGYLGAHSVGVPDGGPGMPLTGWSTIGGDLRIPHFVGLHAFQAIPLAALLLTLASSRVRMLRDERTIISLIRVFAAGYLGLIALLVWQAERAQPLSRPDTITALVGGGLLLCMLVACAGILLQARNTRGSHIGIHCGMLGS